MSSGKSSSSGARICHEIIGRVGSSVADDSNIDRQSIDSGSTSGRVAVDHGEVCAKQCLGDRTHAIRNDEYEVLRFDCCECGLSQREGS